MTRLASILGVATVATLVLLSGCEAAVKTDYAKNLAGTWTVGTMGAIPNLEHAADPSAPATIQVPTDVTAAIVDGPGANKGTFTLTVVNNIPVPTDPPTVTMATTTGSGSFTVTATEIKVTLDTISANVPANLATALKSVEHTLAYKLADNSLEISSDLLPTLGVMAKLTFMNQAANS